MTAQPTVNAVAEIVTFTLAEGIDDAQFLTVMQQTMDFARANPGFRARTLSKGEDGRWTDHVVWDTMETAKSMAAQFMEQEFAPAVGFVIDPDSIEMRHQHVYWGP